MAEDNNNQPTDGYSLKDLADTIRKENSNTETWLETSAEYLQDINLKVAQMVDYLAVTAEALTGNALLEEERRRELLALLEGLGKDGDDNNNQQNNNNQNGVGLGELGLAAGLAALAGLLTGAVLGYIQGVLKILKKFTIDPIVGLFKAIGKGIAKALKLDVLFANVRKAVVDDFAKFQKEIKNAVRFVRLRAVGLLATVRNGFSALIEPITNRFKEIRAALFGEGSAIAKFKKFFTGLFDSGADEAVESVRKAALSPFEKIKGFFSGKNSIFKPITSFFDDLIPFFERFKALGKGLGKIFAPLGVILSIFDGANEAEEAAEKVGAEGGASGFFKKMLAGVLGFIGGVIDGAVAQLADLIKDGLAWVAGKLGFTEIEEKLNSFSFSEMWNKVLDEIYALIDSPLDWIKKKFAGLKDGVGTLLEGAVDFGNMVSNLVTELLRGAIGALREVGAPDWLIPDKLYELAGLNPETGEIIQPAETSATGSTFRELQSVATEAGMDMNEVTARMSRGETVVIGDRGFSADQSGGISVVPIEPQPRKENGELFDSVAFGPMA